MHLLLLCKSTLKYCLYEKSLHIFQKSDFIFPPFNAELITKHKHNSQVKLNENVSKNYIISKKKKQSYLQLKNTRNKNGANAFVFPYKDKCADL